jgi:ubiquinone biosynthesis monooxygenase Coq6
LLVTNNNGYARLDIGAWNYVNHSRVQPYDGMQVWDGLTDSRISFDWAETQQSAASSTIAYMIENNNLTTALQAYLKSLGSTTIFSPARVEGIAFGEDTEELDLSSWPVVTLSNGQNLAARLLIGADGANSPVRTFAGIQSRGWDYNRMGVVATIQLSEPGRLGPEHKIAYQRFLPTGPVAMLPLPGNMASLVWSTLPERAAKLKSLKSEDFVAMVNAAFRLSAVDLTYLHTMSEGQKEEVEWRAQHTKFDEEKVPVRVVGVQEGSVAPFPLKMRHADSYIKERIALVGYVYTSYIIPLLFQVTNVLLTVMLLIRSIP